MKNIVGEGKSLIEFGLRRAQGPDGAMMASQYSYLGGFHGTSNVAAGKAYGIKTVGTLSHSYICSFDSLEEVQVKYFLRIYRNLEIRRGEEGKCIVYLCLILFLNQNYSKLILSFFLRY